MLPDALDAIRALVSGRTDVTVTPDPLAPDAQLIANALAQTIHRAAREGCSYSIRLNAIRECADRWLPYTVTIDRRARTVCVVPGRPVDSAGCPLAEPVSWSRAEARLRCDVRFDMLASVRVNGGDGVVLRFSAGPPGGVRMMPSPDGQGGTHGLVAAVLAGGAASLIGGEAAGIAAAAGYALHIAADMPGYRGCALLSPFCRRRFEGFRLIGPSRPLPGLALAWLAVALLCWNLAGTGPSAVCGLHPLQYWGYAVALPFAAILLVVRADAV